MSPDTFIRDNATDARAPRCRAARGVTLVELLVVIALIMMVTAAAIPVMAPAIQNRRVREASRLVSSYLAAARSRAIETGRPVGVVINGFTTGLASTSNATVGTTNFTYSMSLSMAESQTPYAGDVIGSTAYVSYNVNTNTNPYSYYLQINGFPYDAIGNQHIQTGDRIRLDYQGTYFYITNPNGGYVGNNSVTTSSPLYLYPYSQSGSSLSSYSPATYFPSSNIPSTQSVQTNGGNGLALPYQILRQPVRSSVDPLQLPEGIVIDMQWSGMSTGSSAVQNSSGGYNSGVFTGAASPIISFGPNGSVDMLYDNGTQHASGPIYLLLGRNEQVFPPTNSSTPYPQNNLGDLNSMWICVNNQTGQVSTNANYNPSFATNLGHFGVSAFSTTPSADIITARTLASGSTATVTVQGGN